MIFTVPSDFDGGELNCEFVRRTFIDVYTVTFLISHRTND